MEKREEGWQELVRQAREQIKADLRGRDLPPPERILAQVREERDEHFLALYSSQFSSGEADADF